MEIYEAISLIRKNKNIKVSDVIGQNMARSTFNRYINGETDLYSYNLIQILDSLRVSLDEVIFIANDYADSEQNQLLKDISISFEKRDLNQLKYWRDYCENRYNKKGNILYNHLKGLSEVLIHRLCNKEIEINNNSLYAYLIKTETWTRYEIIMFNNAMFYFNKEAVKRILPRATNRLGRYRDFNHYTDESYRLLTNAIVFFLQNNEIKEALHYIKILEKIELTENQVFERLIAKLFRGFRLLIINSSEADDEIKDCFKIMDLLGLVNLKRMSESANDFLSSKKLTSSEEQDAAL